MFGPYIFLPITPSVISDAASKSIGIPSCFFLHPFPNGDFIILGGILLRGDVRFRAKLKYIKRLILYEQHRAT